MQQAQLLFDNSPWLVIPSLVIGAIYALLLYVRSKGFRNGSWGKRTNYLLTGLRFLLVSIICLLLIGPFIRQIKNTLEQPIVVLAIDNSTSVAAVTDSTSLQTLKSSIAGLTQYMGERGYTTEIRTYDGRQTVDSLQFDHASSDLEDLLSAISSDYEGRNLASVVLLSDGIYNQGVSPTFRPYSFRVNTVGLGDTIPKQDINIQNLYYNKIAYQGNKFPMVAEVANVGFAGQAASVTVANQGRVVASKTLRFDQNRGVNSVEFLLDASQEGMQRYEVAIQVLDGEFTEKNNSSQAFVDVIEGKENILLLAGAPHPDVKALRAAIESNKNYELTSIILSIDDPGEQQFAGTKYDLIIFHQLPGRYTRSPLVQRYLEEASSALFVVGSQSDLSALSSSNPILNISSLNYDTDEVRAVYNSAFSGFQIGGEQQAVIEEFLPLNVPFARFELQNNPEVLLYQKVGSVETSKPLLVVGEVEERKTAIMLGEGLWQWRLQEYAKNENTVAFDEMISKLTQYLSAKEDKRRFKVYTEKEIFEDTEPVVFETEIYNEIYEEVYGYDVALEVTNELDESRSYSYITNENNTRYRVSNLPEGIYQYQAQANIDGERLQSAGEFTVRSLQIETLNLTANHQLLRQLSTTSGGVFFDQAEINNIGNLLEEQEAKGKIYTSEAYLPIINLKWLFFVLLALVTMEWGIRKYMGSY